MLRINLIKQPTTTVDWIDFQEGDVLFVNYIENNESVQKPCKIIYADSESVGVELDVDTIPEPFVFSYIGFNPSISDINGASEPVGSSFDRIDNAYSDAIQGDLTNAPFYMSQKTNLVTGFHVGMHVECTPHLPEDVNTLYAVGKVEGGYDYFIRYERQENQWVYKSGFDEFASRDNITFHVFDNVDVAIKLYDNYENQQDEIKQLGGRFYGETQTVSFNTPQISYDCLQDLNPKGQIVNNNDECDVFNNGKEIQNVSHDGSAIK